MTSVTITFYGFESNQATNELRQKLKDVSTALYDDCGDYFILYQVRYIRREPHLTYIVFDTDDYVFISSEDYDIAL